MTSETEASEEPRPESGQQLFERLVAGRDSRAKVVLPARSERELRELLDKLEGSRLGIPTLREVMDNLVDVVNEEAEKLDSQMNQIVAEATQSGQPPEEQNVENDRPGGGGAVDTAGWESRLATARRAALEIIRSLDLMGRIGNCWPTPLTQRYIAYFQRLRGKLVMQAHDLFESLKPVDDELTETAAKIRGRAVSACGQSGANAHVTAAAIAEGAFYGLGQSLGGKQSARDPMGAYRQPLCDGNRNLVEGALSPLKHEDLDRLKADVRMESKLTAKRLREKGQVRSPGDKAEGGARGADGQPAEVGAPAETEATSTGDPNEREDNKSTRSATANQLMAEMLLKNPEATGWNSSRWATEIKRTRQTVTATETWKVLEGARLKAKAERMEDRRRKRKASDQKRH